MRLELLWYYRRCGGNYCGINVDAAVIIVVYNYYGPNVGTVVIIVVYINVGDINVGAAIIIVV